MEKLNLTEEAILQLQEGISIVFSRWREIQDAVNLGFAGLYTREKARLFESSVFDFFFQPNRKRKEALCRDDLDDLLYEGLDSLCLVPCDDIVEEVAEKLMIMYEECLEGNYQSIQKLREAMPLPSSVLHLQARNDVDDDDDDEVEDDDAEPSMMVDSSDNHPHDKVDMEVDEWVTVTRRKNKGMNKGMKKSSIS